MNPGTEIEAGIVSALRAMELAFAKGQPDLARKHFARARLLHSRRSVDKVAQMEAEKGLSCA